MKTSSELKTRLAVQITDERRTYSETIWGDDLADMIDYFVELKTNGANPDLKDTSWKEWTRSLPKFELKNIEQYNSNHFVYGWIESFQQSDSVPTWIRNAENLWVEVLNE